MNYLELCQALCREAGISTTRLDDVVGHAAGGDLDRVCNWIRQAWEEIKILREDFRWSGHLTKKDDTPTMPERFHMAIVYLALQKYAAHEAAPEVYAYALDRFKFYLARMETDQLDRLRLGNPLA